MKKTDVMTVEEAAEELKIGVRQIYKLIKANRLRTVQGIRPVRIIRHAFYKTTGLVPPSEKANESQKNEM